MHLADLAVVLDRQDGVISRGQLLAGGAQVHDIQRWLRRNELRRVLPGVFLSHTGHPTWRQRAWLAVRWAEPAALARDSAVRAAGGRAGAERDPIQLLVGTGRKLQTPDWIVLHRCHDLDSAVRWTASPPRQREEQAALDLALEHLARGGNGAHLAAVAALTEPVQARRTTALRLLSALDERQRVAHRAWLAGVIVDIGSGATSVLERGFVHRVQRPHALPAARLQVADQTTSGAVIRDALVLRRQVIELDGRAFHQGAARRDADLERDLDAATAGLGTTRLGWGQVYDRPCVTAGKVGALLVSRGWAGPPRACAPSCVAPAIFARALDVSRR